MVFSKSSAVVYSFSLISASTPSSSPPTTPISISRMILAAAACFSSSCAISRFSSIGTAEPSHMCDWNSGFLPFGDALGRDRQQRPDVGVELVLRAVVGVQRDGDRVLRGDDVRELGQRDRAGDHVLDAEAGSEFGTAGGELDDAVAAGVGEALDRRVDRLR